MENETEVTFQQHGITDKEMHVHDRRLMDLLLDTRPKGSRCILSIHRWNKAMIFLELEFVDVYVTIKMAECVKIKSMRKGLVSKNRGVTEAELDADIFDKPITGTTNDVRICVDTNMFDFGKVVSANSDGEGESNVGDEDFLNKTRVNRKIEFDNAIKLWIRYIPGWKMLRLEELGDEIFIVVNDLCRVELKVHMDDISETHNYGLLPLIMK